MELAEFISIRKTLGLTQGDMCVYLGISLRTLQEVEAGTSRLRDAYVHTAERVALRRAVEKGDINLAPAGVRRDALALARLIEG